MRRLTVLERTINAIIEEEVNEQLSAKPKEPICEFKTIDDYLAYVQGCHAEEVNHGWIHEPSMPHLAFDIR